MEKSISGIILFHTQIFYCENVKNFASVCVDWRAKRKRILRRLGKVDDDARSENRNAYLEPRAIRRRRVAGRTYLKRPVNYCRAEKCPLSTVFGILSLIAYTTAATPFPETTFREWGERFWSASGLMKTSARSRNVTRRIITTILLSPPAQPVLGGSCGSDGLLSALISGNRYHMITIGRYRFSLPSPSSSAERTRSKANECVTNPWF